MQDYYAKIGGVDIIVYEGKRTDRFGHSYFASNPRVSADLVELIRYGTPPGAPGRPLIRSGSRNRSRAWPGWRRPSWRWVVEPETWETGEGGKLGGRVNLALKSEEGNTDKNEIDFDYMLDYRRRWHRIESSGILEYDNDTAVEAKGTDATLHLKLGY